MKIYSVYVLTKTDKNYIDQRFRQETTQLIEAIGERFKFQDEECKRRFAQIISELHKIRLEGKPAFS